MSAEQESGQTVPSAARHDEPPVESLTDLIDRMDREAFRRSLEQRDLRVLSTTVRVPR
jgi:hypothetical protein